ncbi:MAG: hypothetical protein ACFFG0_24405 [Candidatus Thorarchaeota archaeon]
MTDNESELVYNHLERGDIVKVFIDDDWKVIIDIEEDARKGWVCHLDDDTKINMENIDSTHIYVIQEETLE